MIGRMNIPIRGSEGGESPSLNVFAQSTEPTTKNGIWINTSATNNLPSISKLEYDGIEIIKPSWDENNVIEEMKAYPLYMNPAYPVYVEPYIYLFGCANTGRVLKYNTNTNKYVEVPNVNVTGYNEYLVIGSDIYLFSLSSSTSQYFAKKYNTLDDTVVNLALVPYNCSGGKIVIKNTNVFIFGSSNSTYEKYMYKYDILNKTMTRMTDIPDTNRGGIPIAVGNWIWIFSSSVQSNSQNMCAYIPVEGSKGYYTYSSTTPISFKSIPYAVVGTNIYFFGTLVYKFDTLTREFTELAQLPETFISGSEYKTRVNGRFIYLFGVGSNKNNIFKYDTENNSFTKITSTIYQYLGIGNTLVDDDIYAFVNYHCLKITNRQLKNNYIYLITENCGYKVPLTTNLAAEIVDAHICQNGELKEYPAYYGDGTQWNLLS